MELHIRYCLTYSQQLENYLFANQITYRRTDEKSGLDALIFTITDRNDQFQRLKQELLPMAEGEGTVLEYAEYSEAERRAAPWLTCRAITGGKLQLARETETFTCKEYISEDRAYHRFLSGKPFYTNKPVRHTPSQNFFWAYGATDHNLFCTERAKKLLEQFAAPVAFRDVLHAKTEQPIGDLYYMDILCCLPDDAVDLSCAYEEYTCPICGQKTWFPPKTQPLLVKESALAEAPAICKTPQVFSYGGNISFSIILFSQNMYQTLRGHKMDRGLEFEPIRLIL